MRLIHYSFVPLTHIWSEPAEGQPIHAKPRGIWVSVEGEQDWPSWCAAEQWNLDAFAHAAEIRLTPGAGLLVLKSAADLYAFTDRYLARRSNTYRIAWPKVAAIYQGIIIAPYIWECRLSGATDWYYGWDCASGCIWDNAAIDEIVPTETVDMVGEQAA